MEKFFEYFEKAWQALWAWLYKNVDFFRAIAEGQSNGDE